MAQQVKDPVLALLLWCRFDPWPRNFHMPGVAIKKKKKNGTILLKASCISHEAVQYKLSVVCDK